MRSHEQPGCCHCHHRRKAVPFKGWLALYLAAAIAWGLSPLAGITATAVLAVIIAIAARVRHNARKAA